MTTTDPTGAARRRLLDVDTQAAAIPQEHTACMVLAVVLSGLGGKGTRRRYQTEIDTQFEPEYPR